MHQSLVEMIHVIVVQERNLSIVVESETYCDHSR